MRSRFAVAVAAGVLALACGDNEPTLPRNSTNTMSATVNGAAWEASASRFATFENLVLTISGQNSAGLTVRIAIANITLPGTYTLGPGNPNAALGNLIDGSAIWASSLQGGSGTLTLVVLSSDRVAGSFSFAAVPATGSATGTSTVFNGNFDLSISP